MERDRSGGHGVRGGDAQRKQVHTWAGHQPQPPELVLRHAGGQGAQRKRHAGSAQGQLNASSLQQGWPSRGRRPPREAEPCRREDGWMWGAWEVCHFASPTFSCDSVFFSFRWDRWHDIFRGVTWMVCENIANTTRFAANTVSADRLYSTQWRIFLSYGAKDALFSCRPTWRVMIGLIRHGLTVQCLFVSGVITW